MSDKQFPPVKYRYTRPFNRVLLPQYKKLKSDRILLYSALTQLKTSVFEYIPSSCTIRFLECETPPFGLPQQFDDAIEHILSKNIIHPESRDDFCNLFSQITEGSSYIYATLKMNRISDSSSHIWNRVSLTSLCVEDGQTRIVGTIQNVTDRLAAELHYSQEEQYRLAMLADSRRVYEINVSKDKLMHLESIQDSRNEDNWKPYTQEMNNLRKNSVYPEDWKGFLQIADRNRLLNAYKNGTSELYCEYRVVMPDGSLTWTSSTTHLLKDPFSGDIKAFTYAKDITSQKEQELLLKRQAEQDALTGLFNRATAEKKITTCLLEQRPGIIHGFFSIDIDGFKQVNDTFGHLQGDALLQQLSAQLKKSLRKEDILSRTGGDEFIVFLKNALSTAYIEKVAKRLINCTRKIPVAPGSSKRMSISLGIAVSPKDGTTFLELYKNSDSALYAAKNKGKNCFAMYEAKHE